MTLYGRQACARIARSCARIEPDMSLFTLDELSTASAVVGAFVLASPAYSWPVLRKSVGAEVIVKHENHTPTGSFKARGALTYVEALRRTQRMPKGLVTATRGNHGQSVAIAAARYGIPALIVVPEANSVEKNAAIEAFGGQLLIAGKDFDESRTIAAQIEQAQGYHFVPSFHRDLVAGVATYAHELFTAWQELDGVFASLGMGYGFCGILTVWGLVLLQDYIV